MSALAAAAAWQLFMTARLSRHIQAATDQDMTGAEPDPDEMQRAFAVLISSGGGWAESQLGGGSQARCELPREARSDSTCRARWGCRRCPRWGLRPPCARRRVAPRGERKVVLRLGDALDREGAPDALERVAGRVGGAVLGEVGPSGAKANEVVRRENGPVGAENCVVAGQAAFRYSLMSPPQRAVLTTWRCLSGWSGGLVATGGR